MKPKINYDEDADVLYISFGESREAIATEFDDGDFVRVDADGKIAGITIMDFKERFLEGD